MNEYLIKQPLHKWWLTALIIIANVAVFACQVLAGISITDPSILDLIHWGADFAPLTLSTENWRLISSMFLHIGIVHLLVNMWALYLFGVYAEFYYSRLWYVVIYAIAGIAGNLASSYVSLQHAFEFMQSPSRDLVPSVGAGASGAIMGLGGALLIAALWPKKSVLPMYRLNKNALIMLMLINLGLGLFVSGINNAAHLGGFIGGAVLALGYRVSLLLPNTTKYPAQIAVMIAGAYAVVYSNQWLMEQAQQVMPFWSMYLK
ncbi:rhomboid family intramembrane serine protease [Alkanindiges sp. WGS2144]|uniref:rhomboid family intramembrane serine protease n=1 Tax=Alkanindiges sp. WGS2144 TaxID=3366808 RepID=UPI003751C773